MNIKRHALESDLPVSITYIGELADRLPKREITEITSRYRNLFFRDVEIHTEENFIKLKA